MAQVHEASVPGVRDVIVDMPTLESPSPQYTQRDATNKVIHRIARGQDIEHPVMGLGNNWAILGEALIRKKGQEPYMATRFIFANTPGPQRDGWELSFVAREYSDGRVDVIAEGIMPRSERF